MLKTPIFWKKKGLISFVLIPFSYFYYLIHILFSKIKKEVKIDVPIICVGNAVIGGSGKTPIVIKLRNILKKEFLNIFVLTRGYDGLEKGPLLVNNTHSFVDVGDEAILHAKYGKTCISKNKIEGGNFCKNNSADLIILDDGLQSKNLKKDISILVIDGNYGFGNCRIFPSGPLRESIKRSIVKSDAILVLGKMKLNRKDPVLNEKKIFFAKKIMRTKNLKNKELIAFSGLGNNQNFLDGLKELGFKVKKFLEFPDHHKYKVSEISKIIDISRSDKLSVVTTMKDYIRVPIQFQKKINIIELDILIQKESNFLKFLNKKLLEFRSNQR